MAASRADTSAGAYRLLERRATAAVLATLAGLTAAAWAFTVYQSQAMQPGGGGMALASGTMGGMSGMGGMAIDPSLPFFLPMWTSMMVAMMLPTVAPMVLGHRLVSAGRGDGWAPTVAFVLGYLAVWTVIGLVPLGVLLGVHRLPAGDWLRWLSGGALVLAGGYQYTRWKAACLKTCQSPLGFLMSHDFGSGGKGAFRAGLRHGAYCLGCCWALMAVLVVVGLMNLVWMAVLAAIFLAEKNWRLGLLLSRVTGVAVALLGLAVIADPGLLAVISGGWPAPARGGRM